jgi:hypothetical protein
VQNFSNIYVDGKQDESIYVFGQHGHINLDGVDYQRDDFTTNYGLKGSLLSKETEGKMQIYLILDDEFHGAHISISSECYKQNKEQIMAVLRSIKVGVE